MASTLSDEVVQDEEEEESSRQPIRIEDSLLTVTPSPDALEVYEIYDIHLLICIKHKNTFESMILNKNTTALPCKHSLVIFF